MYGEGNSAKMIEDVMLTTGKIMEGIEGSTGLDVKALISGALGGKLLSGNSINIEGVTSQIIDAINEPENK